MIENEKEITNYIGKRIRVIREELNISQEILGKHLNVSFQQIQKYEKGANRISPAKLKLVCQLFCVPISCFYEETTIHRKETQLLIEYRKLKEIDKLYLKRTIELLIK